MRTRLLPLFAAFSLALLTACGGEAHSDDGPSSVKPTGPVGQWTLDIKATRIAHGKPYEPEKERARARKKVEEYEAWIAESEAKLADLKERQSKSRRPQAFEDEIADEQEYLDFNVADLKSWKRRLEEPYATEHALRFELREDGAFIARYDDEQVGTWTREGDALQLTIPKADAAKPPEVFQATIDGDRLTVRTDEGKSLVFERVP